MMKKKTINQKKIVVNSHLKRNKIKVNSDAKNGILFIIPEDLKKKLKQEYNFSIDMLNVGGDINPADLVAHIDEHPSVLIHIGTISEQLKVALETYKQKYELWQEQKFYKCKKSLMEIEGKTVTDKYVNAYISSKYNKEKLKFIVDIQNLELNYRMYNNVIRSAIEKKGELLQTLKGIVINSNFDWGNSRVPKKVRFKLKNMIGGNHGGKKTEKEKK